MRNSSQSMSNSLAPQHLPLRRSVTVDDARASKCICSGDALRTLVVGEEGTVTVALPFKSTAIRSHAWRAGSNYADRPVLTVRVMRARNKTSTVVFEEKTTAILEAGRAHLRVGRVGRCRAYDGPDDEEQLHAEHENVRAQQPTRAVWRRAARAARR